VKTTNIRTASASAVLAFTTIVALAQPVTVPGVNAEDGRVDQSPELRVDAVRDAPSTSSGTSSGELTRTTVDRMDGDIFALISRETLDLVDRTAEMVAAQVDQLVGREVDGDPAGSDPFGNDDRGPGNPGGSSVPSRPGTSSKSGSGSSGICTGDDTVDALQVGIAGGLADGGDTGKKEEPAEPKKEDPKTEEPANGGNNGSAGGNEQAPSLKERAEGAWEAVSEPVVNFLKGVAGALTGWWGSVAMSLPTTVEEARDHINGILGIKRLGETGTSHGGAAEQMRESERLKDHPDAGGSTDPCDDYNWFRETLPHLAGTQWDPYARIEGIEDGNPMQDTNCGPAANPGPDGTCEPDPEHEHEPAPNSGDDGGPGPDCFEPEGCGAPEPSPGEVDRIIRVGDPSNPCGITAVVGPDGDCGSPEGDDEQMPDLLPEPGCEICDVLNISGGGVFSILSGGALSTNNGTNDPFTSMALGER
jgi:hypothetical protein